MPFPVVERVVYRNNPLDRVVGQVRFPPLLRIDAEIPAEFHEKIRTHFPNFVHSTEVVMPVPLESLSPFPAEVASQLVRPASFQKYEFGSEDGVWTVHLTRTFVSLTTTRYERWEQFRERFELPFRSLLEVYQPAYFSRIGLRYIDIIRRSILGLKDQPWGNLLQPYISSVLGPLGDDAVRNFRTEFEVTLEDGSSQVRLISQFVQRRDTTELCFSIDGDYFTVEKVEVVGAMEKLNYLNVRASRLIRWCITDVLHQAMEPQRI